MDGELFPINFNDIMNLYVALKKGAESNDNPNISEQNRSNANSIIGAGAPAGPNSNAAPRSSVRKENAKSLKLVTRTKGASSIVDVDSDSSATPESRRRKKKNKYDIQGTIEQSNTSKAMIAKAIESMSNNRIPSEEMMNLRREELKHKKEMNMLQLNLSIDKMKHRERESKIKEDAAVSKAKREEDAASLKAKQDLVNILHKQLDVLFLQYRMEKDDFIKEIMKENITRTNGMLRKATDACLPP